MPKFSLSLSRRLLLLIGVALPSVLFMETREATDWRPQLVGRQDSPVNSWNNEHGFLTLSADEQCLASTGDEQSTIWDLNARKRTDVLAGANVAFSRDSRLIAAYVFSPGETPPMISLYGAFGAVVWSKDIELHDDSPLLEFTPNDSQLCYSFSDSNLRIFLDAKTGRVLKKQLSPRHCQQTTLLGLDGTHLILSFAVPKTKKTFSFETSSEGDIWQTAPDGNHLWVSMLARGRFDIRDAVTGKLLWSYQSNASSDGVFRCYPSWEDGGKTLATIENDTLIVRDARTGNVLSSHKNNLSSPLKSWALTHDGKTAYLLDGQGEIYRQRLR